VLELKNTFDPADIVRIIEIIKAEDYLHGIIFISFSLENMICVRNLLPEQPCQFLTSQYADDLVDTLKKHRLDLDIYYPRLTAERVQELHDNGIKVNCWTCDKPADAEELIRMGVDFITSNILE